MTRTVKKDGVLTPTTDEKRLPVVIDEKPKFRLHVDADRDGVIDDDPNGLDKWEPGKGKKGAIVLVNNNGTKGSGVWPNMVSAKIDHDDDVLKDADDVADVTPLDIRRTGPTPPSGFNVVLSIATKHAPHIRVFDRRTVAGKEVLGPTKGGSYQLPDLSPAKLELGIEAISYAGKYNGTPFDGDVMLTLTTFDGTIKLEEHQALFRVAPWIMFNHLDAANKLFVMTDRDNADLVKKLRDLAPDGPDSVHVVDGSKYYDVWLQDIMEFGFSERPGRAALRNVLETPRPTSRLTGLPQTLVESDLGYLRPVDGVSGGSSLNSGGNLECTPPFTDKAGRFYPFGRVYFCEYRRGATSDRLTDGYAEFIRAQRIQDPLELDAGWLNVGHMDEFISFVPAPGAKKFKMLVASPRLGMKLLREARSTGGQLLTGKRYARGLGQISATDLWRNGIDYGLDDRGIGEFKMSGPEFRAYNTECQSKISAVRKKLMEALDLRSTDVAEVPILYVRKTLGDGTKEPADALTAGMVNMLVVGTTCIFPLPYGPNVAGTDSFLENMKSTLILLGLTPEPVEDWETYHLMNGEVHCGTNTLRTSLATTKWWEVK